MQLSPRSHSVGAGLVGSSDKGEHGPSGSGGSGGTGHCCGQGGQVAQKSRSCNSAAGSCRKTTSSRPKAEEVSPAWVRLSELFAPRRDSLVIYTMMFPRDR